MSHERISKNGSPPPKVFMWDTKQNSNALSIGLGIDYVTWTNIQKGIPAQRQIFKWATE